MRRLILAFLVTAASVTDAGASRDFLIPGADVTRLTLREGAWCRYVVVDEAFGVTDSTEIYVAVSATVETEAGDAYWVEVENRLLGDGGSVDFMKLLVLGNIADFADGDSLGRYVLELYIKNGSHPPQREDPGELDDFSLAIPTTDSWSATDGVMLNTPAGRFETTRKQRSVDESKRIPAGNVIIIKTARDDFSVWFTDDVPMFHMVKCEIRRFRNTDTEPRISGVPVAGGKDSRTTAELIGFGFDATPILPDVSRTSLAD